MTVQFIHILFKKKCRGGIKFQRETIQMLRISDDIVLLADPKRGLQKIVNCMDDILKELQLTEQTIKKELSNTD